MPDSKEYGSGVFAGLVKHLPPDVACGEYNHVRGWRKRQGIDGEAQLAGLAFSGGGLRSATFNLGVLEALRDLRLLPRFDYLSSVSGGGFIMSWLCAHCQRDHGNWLAADNPTVERWDRSIAHLSKFSNYLSPRVGLFSADTWTMLTVWARNAVLVQLSVISLVVLALLLPRLIFFGFDNWPGMIWVRALTVVLFLLAILVIAANQLHQRRREMLQSRFGVRLWWAWAIGACLLLAGAAWLWVDRHFNPFSIDGSPMLALEIALPLVAGLACALPAAVRAGVFGNGRDWPDFGQGQVQAFVVFPLLLTGIELSGVLWQFSVCGVHTFGSLFTQGFERWPFQLALAFASLAALTCCSLKEWGWCKLCTVWRVRVPVVLVNVLLIGVTCGVCVLALHAMLSGIVLLMKGFDPLDGRWHAYVWGPTLLLVAFGASVTLMIGMLGLASLESMREWWSRLAAWLAIYAAGWTLVTVAAFYGPMLLPMILQWDDWKSLVPVLGWLGTTAAGLFAAHSGATKGDNKIRSGESNKSRLALELIARAAPPLFIVGLLVAVAIGVNVVLWNLATPGPVAFRIPFGVCAPAACFDRYWDQMDTVSLGMTGAVFAAVVLGALVLTCRVDINEFSLHGFYRSRLVRCYLGASRQRKPQRFTQFDDGDDLPLSASAVTNGDGPKTPLHLLNCTVNLGGSADLALHTRHGASFTLTPYVAGSGYPELAQRDKIGFVKHAAHADAGFNPMLLGEAMAVSGAAASPNMGFHTSPAVAFMMTMFNARLGRWLANPRYGPRRCSPLFSTAYLLKELFGIADERSHYLMVSDGGHFENLGAYELVRRGCRLIVVSDAECDPDMRFGALGTLIRLCKVDFNARIEIDVGPLGIDPVTGISKAHCAVGRIVYERGEPGVLIYMKASFTDAVRDASLWQYHATHPAFPQESTGDQFYGEDQFESYRRLGRHIARQAFGPALSGNDRGELARVRPDFANLVN